jgi:hypothetical protein
MGDGAGRHRPEIRHRVLSADESEAELLAQFTAHDLFADIERLERDAFLEVLLQRRFLSLLFPVVYDAGIDGLADETAIRLAREILREEYPDPTGATPSHREDLVSDLLALGATRAQILASRPTAVTTSVIEETLALMLDAAAAGGDVAVLTILRFWGEVLVSVEYGEFWRRMEGQFETAGVASRFYHPHHHHDGREPLALASDASSTHSGRLGACLARLLAADGAADRFAGAEQQVLGARMRFYDQFVAER